MQTSPLKVMLIVGARPNFPKVAPIIAEMAQRADQFSHVLVHTGQHYDHNMSSVFFEQLSMPEPDEFLNVGSGSHAQQTAKVMSMFEPVLEKHAPDWVLVVGDVNSTIACALVAAKMGIRVAHVEAGLRSRDRSMPEELNRLVTDQLADLLLTPSYDADENLLAEGIDRSRICCVGNVMIDTLIKMLPHADNTSILDKLKVKSGEYALVTLHRPSNVDDPIALKEIFRALTEISLQTPIVFPVHPRTRSRMADLGLTTDEEQFQLIDPAGYLDFLALMKNARVVITDSGGVQEETTYLGIPCLTVRPNTERPVTISEGSNRLVSGEYDDILSSFSASIAVDRNERRCPELWDGEASGRVCDALLNFESP